MGGQRRWRQVEGLVAAALEKPPGERFSFLADATADVEAEVRQEAESLLACATAEPDFLERLGRELVAPALLDALAEVEVPAPAGIGPGVILAERYRVLERTGGGGMGVVFLAIDTRLDREVALKLLPGRAHRDPAARRRFVQEARAASALDHPNIGTVHDILEVSGGRDCIVMAHYPGRTLRELLADGPMDIGRACGLAAQVASGLAAAHRRGIVHCDVKPENVVVTEDGVAKVVDFGLARFGESGGPAGTAGGGTLPYMAPEQIRRLDVTPRTDVWALGVMLHEMLWGRRPFAGRDPERLAHEILEGDAVDAPGDSSVPPWLGAIVRRALSRRPADRFADAGGVRTSLQRGIARLEGAESLRRPGGMRLAGAAAGVAVVGLAAAWMWSRSAAPRFSRPLQLSAAEGVEDFAVWSPEGDAILYQATPGGEVFGGSPDVWIRSLDSEVPRNLTSGHSGFDGQPSWAPDGSRFAFYSEREGGGYFVQDLAGGPPRKVWSGLPPGGAHNVAAWSPDGDRIAVTVDAGAEGSALEIVAVSDGTLERRVDLPGRAGNLRFGTTWSHDGRFVATADAMNLTPDESRLWIIRLADGEAVPVTEGRDLAWSPSWGEDGRSLYYVSDRGGGRDLWMQSLDSEGRPRGEPREITTGIGMRNAAVSRDGGRLVYSQGRIVATAWRVPVKDDGPATWEDAERLTSDRAYVEFVEVDPHSGDLYVSSDRAGSQDVWRFASDGGGGERLTSPVSSDWAPMISPDGRRMAYYSARSGNRDLWVRDLETGDDLRVTRHDAIDFVPSWSPDGRALAFASGRTGNLDVWTVDLEDGTLRQLTRSPAMDAWPQWSPDGATVAFRSNRDGVWRVWRVPAEGGVEPSPVTEVATTYFRFSPDGSALYLVGPDQLWMHDLATGREQPVTALEQRQGAMGVVALAEHDGSLYFTWEEDIGDLWMMERTR